MTPCYKVSEKTFLTHDHILGGAVVFQESMQKAVTLSFREHLLYIAKTATRLPASLHIFKMDFELPQGCPPLSQLLGLEPIQDEQIRIALVDPNSELSRYRAKIYQQIHVVQSSLRLLSQDKRIAGESTG